MKKRGSTPPALAAWILSRITRGEDRLSILSDFSEIDEEMASEEGNFKARKRMQPLFQIYLFPINGSNTVVKYLTIFAIIAFVVLMIACINFMNLTTAYSSKRPKEIGMRKVVGAQKGDIVKQFFGESLMLSLVSSGVAVLLAFLFLPAFNTLSGKPLSFTDSFELSLLLELLGITVLSGCLSAIYPALFLSSFRTIGIIKGSLSSGFKKPLFRFL